MPEVIVRTGKLGYIESGSGQPLVLLHANPGDHRDYDSVIAELAQRFRVLALDWPGYGLSDPPNPPSSASAMLFAQVLEDFFVALDLSEAIIIGNSVGGYAATSLALRLPERVAGLVVVSPGGFTPPGWFNRVFIRFKGQEWVTRRAASLLAHYYLKRRNEGVRQILARTATNRNSLVKVAVDAAVWRSFLAPDHDLRDKARGLACPTLLVFGRYDPIIKAKTDGKEAAKAIPHAQLKILPTGHMPFAEDSGLFLRTVNPFLEEVSHGYRPSHS